MTAQLSTDSSATPAVFAAFLAVCDDVGAITKSNRVQEGPARFAFRGVDDVMNALHGPMSRHGLVCVPQVQERLSEARSTRGGSTMNVVHVRVRFAFYGRDGSTFHAETWGEGQDSGDKATGKAHSMAYKSALLQAFHVPTEDTPDADQDTTPAEPTRRAQRGVQAPQDDPWQQSDPAALAEWRAELAKAVTIDELRARWADLAALGAAGQVVLADKPALEAEWSAQRDKVALA